MVRPAGTLTCPPRATSCALGSPLSPRGTVGGTVDRGHLAQGSYTAIAPRQDHFLPRVFFWTCLANRFEARTDICAIARAGSGDRKQADMPRIARAHRDRAGLFAAAGRDAGPNLPQTRPQGRP